jgi:hypothetical protein
MQARLDERRRVMFSKSSVLAVVALAAFVSLGALLFPQVGQAQECIWDCDLGSDPFDNTGSNSPGFSIVYCFDQPCVVKLDNEFNIFTGGIPTASVSQSVNNPPLVCDGSTPNTITISGNVIAVARKNGMFDAASAAEALFNLVVKEVICNSLNNLESKIKVGDAPGAVIEGSITILNTPILNAGNLELTKPSGWPGCTNDKKTGDLGPCVYPLGNDQSNTPTQLLNKWGPNPVLYSGNALGRDVSTRMCKGPANKPVSSVVCGSGQNSEVGGFVSDALFNVEVNWSGSGDKSFNPASNTGVIDIVTELFNSIVRNDPLHPVTCSANGGTPVIANSCSTMPGNTVRCNCPAKDMLPGGCTKGEEVSVVVRGSVDSTEAGRLVKFVGDDNPVCNTNK